MRSSDLNRVVDVGKEIVKRYKDEIDKAERVLDELLTIINSIEDEDARGAMVFATIERILSKSRVRSIEVLGSLELIKAKIALDTLFASNVVLKVLRWLKSEDKDNPIG